MGKHHTSICFEKLCESRVLPPFQGLWQRATNKELCEVWLLAIASPCQDNAILILLTCMSKGLQMILVNVMFSSCDAVFYGFPHYSVPPN